MSFLTQPITLQSLFTKSVPRSIGSITVQVLVDESASDVLTVTKQPVQQGATISDHAYKEPTSYSCQILFKDNPSVSLSKLYQNLLDLQNSITPFTIVTPKRIYYSMLIGTLNQRTDKQTQNCLAIQMSCQQVLIVSISTVNVPRSRQSNPGTTGGTQNAGAKQSVALKIAPTALVNLIQGVP